MGCAGVGWDENGMGWARYRYLGCTAFSDWEHRVVVVAEGYGLYLPDVRVCSAPTLGRGDGTVCLVVQPLRYIYAR